MRSDERIVELLEKFRMKAAPSAPFNVMTNSNIESLVKAKPRTLEDLAKIKGFPAHGSRVRNYGERILEIINGVDIQTPNNPADTLSPIQTPNNPARKHTQIKVRDMNYFKK